MVDVAILTFSVLLAWNRRLLLAVWDFSSTHAPVLNLQVAPYLVVLWMLVLSAQGSYSLRAFAEGPDEYRRVGFASFLTACLVGLSCYLLKLPLSRGFIILTFVVGTPLLLLGRFMVRQSAYSLRRNGRCCTGWSRWAAPPASARSSTR